MIIYLNIETEIHYSNVLCIESSLEMDCLQKKQNSRVITKCKNLFNIIILSIIIISYEIWVTISPISHCNIESQIQSSGSHNHS